jgi:O-antigen biosynthesis protein WbqV
MAKKIQLEDLLQRKPIMLDFERIVELVKGKRVLVTGAGGSIGSEISRQLVGFGCSHITLLDQSEYLLFLIDQELERTTTGIGTRSAVLCNVRDYTRLHDIFLKEKPDIIFHAAALKHVSMVENNPCEGVLTNVFGTWNVAKAARESNAHQMVMISTDKAVGPLNIMGATKRIAETLLTSQSHENTRYCVVRFGNVLGSAGSVVPIFEAQIERGGPVTVTDKDVERFFMTIPEAVQLVLHATALSSTGESNKVLRKFVLEMGEPVKIVDLARQVITLSGFRPEVDIKIVYTGLRAGEKMTEELIDENEVGSPCIPGITEIQAKQPEGMIGEIEVTQLSETAERGDVKAIRELIIKDLDRVRNVTPSS